MSKLKTVLVTIGGLLGLLLVTAIAVVAGGVSLGLTGLIIAAVLYFLGVVSYGTAQAVFLAFFAVGALLGILRVLLVILGAGAGATAGGR